MNQQPPSFKLEIDSIPVPDMKLDQIIAEATQQSVPQTVVRKRRFLHRKGIVATLAALLICFAALVGSASFSPVIASMVAQIPIVGDFLLGSRDVGLQRASKQGLTVPLDQSQTADGMTITLRELYYDDTRLSLGYSLQAEHPADLSDQRLLMPRLSINGKAIPTGGNGSFSSSNEYTLEGVWDFDPHQKLPDSFLATFRIAGPDNRVWSFEVPVHMQQKSRNLAVDYTGRAANIKLHITSIRSGIAELNIQYQADSTIPERLRSMSGLVFEVTDQNGNSLDTTGSESHLDTLQNGNVQATGKHRLDPVDEHAKVLHIKPVLHVARPNHESIAIPFPAFDVSLP